MNELLLAFALAATALPSFPRDGGGRISQQAIGVTMGGAPAIVVPAGENVIALRGDGRTILSFRFPLGAGEAASGPAASADMDGDGRPEIAVVTTSGRLFLWSEGIVRGFPVTLGARARAGPSFADVDGDGRPEVLIGDENGRVHAFKRSGREAPGWPASVGSPVTSSVSSSMFGGRRAVAFGCEDGKVHVLDARGRSLPGFPLVTKFSVTGAPAFADIDDDGDMDLVVASQDFGLYVVNSKGQPLPGFPVKAGYRLYDGPAVADVNGDQQLEIVFASADGMVHAVNHRGEPLPGFPVRIGVRLFTGPAVGDLDGDGSFEIVAVAADGALAALSANGKPLPGFPIHLPASELGASPLLFDGLDDGNVGIFVGLPNGALHAFRATPATSPSRAAVPLVAWAGPGRDAARSGRYGPNAPAYKDLTLTPTEPRARDVLAARWRSVWLDAGPKDAVPAARIEWLRDGKHVPELDGKKDLPPGTVKRRERWQFVLTSAGGARRWKSPEVQVANAAPSEPAVALEPAAPARGAGDVSAVIRTQANDPDGDLVSYEIVWLLDGIDTGVKGDRFPAGLLRKGSLLAAQVVATDGELKAPPALAQARIRDTAPGTPRIALEPALPGRSDDVTVRIEAPAADADGDRVVYHYRWTVDGKARNVPLSSARLPGALFHKHQKIEVEVRAADGEEEGAPVRAAVTSRNTAPTAPRVEIRPARPRRGDTLRAAVVAPGEDADGDSISYRFEWRKNGVPFRGATSDGREVPGAEVARGDRFELTATANDGETSGPHTAASVVIGNTPPVAPRIAIEPARPKGGEPLKLVVVEPARDADGQRVALQIAWTRDGRPAGSGQETLLPTEFRKHERVRVLVTPHDGEDAGEPVACEVLVEDAPPSVPSVAFADQKPTAVTPLRAVVTAAAVDPDGDKVRYQYRWMRDGAAIVLADGTAASRAAPFWTSVSEVPTRELRKGQRWTVEVRAHDGEKPGPVARAAVTIMNSPPPPPQIAFAPEHPRRVDGIAVSIQQRPDPDGDVLTYRYSWMRDGQRFEAPPGQAQIPRGVARKGQRWAVEVVANDGESDSLAVRQEVVIADTAPGPMAIALCDGPVPSGTVPEARITVPALDPDGDPITYIYKWTVNGHSVPAAPNQARLSAPPLRKHDQVRVVVTPTDGELAGPPSAGECMVENTPPAPPSITLEPAEPTASRGVSIVVRKASTDRDGDEITYRYAWTRNGIPVPYDKPTIPPNVLRNGETWRVDVTPFDGEEAGGPASASAVVKNTAPPAPTVALVPASPTTGQPLTCEARAPERDADQEAITLGYRWYRNGLPVSIADGGATLPRNVVRRGDKWRCEAWSFDGHAESAHVSAEVTVRNSAPSAPKLVIEPEIARRGHDLFCRVEIPSTDIDGDPVTYAYAWTRNGRAIPPGADAGRIETPVAKGERWRCTVTPSDGTVAGPPASAERIIANTPPGPALVRLQPRALREGEPVRCEIVRKAEDPDGDTVHYRFSWQRNGTPQPFAETSEEVPTRLVKLGDRWRCSVTPTDGLESGPVAGSEEALVEEQGEGGQRAEPPAVARPGARPLR